MSTLTAMGKDVLITGANGGLGLALIEAFLAAGARHVYAACRNPERLTFDHPQVEAVQLDVTDPQQVAQVASRVGVDILVNNAGLNRQQRLLGADDPDAAAQEMAVNYFATLAMMRAFAPTLVERAGAMVNVLSILARVALPAMGSLCASKAAALRLTEAARAELAGQVQVVAVLPGVIDTAMSHGVAGAKASPREVAEAIVTGLASGAAEVYPDPMALDIAHKLATDRATAQADFARYL
ncbi:MULTISPECIES: SDR family NAD(P)-dependent oxidoreductase [unclassified Pseudomonas]|uniref:SDR family NAD(P)-dependent oxidoreductase n=1 Tax=unclassified Pseudomonas TaxID=196821 RepID=UPI0004B4F1D6|nr:MULTISPECIES: SDR family NAD(P)-dependent oxidoreductase [unclassified Pseudomonas]PXX64559.1 short-subunit dehydrogenase [Pseudomonas sp. LAIL14HWK12:I1]SMD12197.1 Short-chain dehydrogenase [Pseudomonas sp. URIL14HWK12:I5]SOC98423.1 Short-chain dehydrogenase [Pseudomonas sp. LAIL14HWK12:I3]